MIRVLVFEDSEFRRESLEHLLQLSDDIQFLGAFPNTDHMEKQLMELEPDVILMDIRMPGNDGIRSAGIARRCLPSVRIIMQTVFDTDENIFCSLKAGAVGYILKSVDGSTILQTIKDVYQGGAVLTPSVALRVTNYFQTSTTLQTLPETLTEREKQILELLSTGLSYKMVAGKLGISYSTVNTHVKRIYSKLNVNSLVEALSSASANRLF